MRPKAKVIGPSRASAPSIMAHFGLPRDGIRTLISIDKYTRPITQGEFDAKMLINSSLEKKVWDTRLQLGQHDISHESSRFQPGCSRIYLPDAEKYRQLRKSYLTNQRYPQ
jgi:hypothetical protein